MSGRKIRSKLPVKIKSVNPENERKQEDLFTTYTDNDSTQEFEKLKNLIRFYGFDKTVNSGSESFFIVNGTDSTVVRMRIEITYYDMQKRQLHQRTAEFDCEIPPHETRRKDIRTWDTQKAFYFHQSARPRRQATPFDVTTVLKSVSFKEGPDKQKSPGQTEESVTE